jgi:thymidylate kinase
MASAKMYVEFTGCSGSGKSTVSEWVIRHLLRRGHHVHSVHATHFSVLGPMLRCVRHPTLQNLLLDAHGLRQCLRSSESREFMQFAGSLLRRHADSFSRKLNLYRGIARKVGVHALMISQENRGEYRIVDEGIIHSAHNLFVHVRSVPDERELQEFVERVPLPDLIVCVRAPLEVLLERTLRRADRPISGDEARLRRYLEHGCMVFDKIISASRLQERTILIDCEAEWQSSVETVAGEIVEHLDKWAGHA